MTKEEIIKLIQDHVDRTILCRPFNKTLNKVYKDYPSIDIKRAIGISLDMEFGIILNLMENNFNKGVFLELISIHQREMQMAHHSLGYVYDEIDKNFNGRHGLNNQLDWDNQNNQPDWKDIKFNDEFNDEFNDDNNIEDLFNGNGSSNN